MFFSNSSSTVCEIMTVNPFLQSFYLGEFHERLNNTKILSRELVEIIYCML